MRRIVRGAILLLAIGALGMQFAGPARTNPPVDPSLALSGHQSLPPDAAAVFDRSCSDCHSNATRWPWYSRVAPVSWFVIDHVNHGRSHFNVSEWGGYDAKRRAGLLEASCTMVRSGAMPLETYLLMHSSARVSRADADALCRWTEAAAAGLGAGAPPR